MVDCTRTTRPPFLSFAISVIRICFGFRYSCFEFGQVISSLILSQLHFRGLGCEGNQVLEECPQFAVVWAMRQSGQELFSQHFSGIIERLRSACEGRRSALSQRRSVRSLNCDLSTSQQHSSTNVYTHWFKGQHPMFDHTLRTCCCPAPHTSFTSWKCSSIAQRAATVSKISHTSADVSVQK